MRDFNLFDRFPDAKQWRQDAEQASIFGQPMSELDREELLAVIGFLAKDREDVMRRLIGINQFWFDYVQGVRQGRH